MQENIADLSSWGAAAGALETQGRGLVSTRRSEWFVGLVVKLVVSVMTFQENRVSLAES